MKRRQFLTAAGVGAVGTLAGCLDVSSDDDSEQVTEDGDPILTVATYDSFLEAPSVSPGGWVEEQFQSEFDATLVWQSPPEEVNYYIERTNAGLGVDADVYLGLNTEELVRADEQLDEPLFAEAPDLDGAENVRADLEFDPDGRAVPFNTGYICIVYDSTVSEAPESFEGLLEDEHSGELIVQNPGTSTPGRAFMLHTIDRFGSDGYLEFWSDLQDNDVTILGSWDEAYGAWFEGRSETPMVVSYSTDQVFAAADGADIDQHQIRFLDDQAYANPEGMAMFEGASNPDLAEEFMEWMLTPEVQGEIAERNVVFPAIEGADVPEEYDELAHEPPEAVTFTYEELQGSVSEWIDDWEREIAG